MSQDCCLLVVWEDGARPGSIGGNRRRVGHHEHREGQRTGISFALAVRWRGSRELHWCANAETVVTWRFHVCLKISIDLHGDFPRDGCVRYDVGGLELLTAISRTGCVP